MVDEPDQAPPGPHASDDERVRLVPYEPGWPKRYEVVQARLEPLLAPWLTGGIHHVGSTAVPGLQAKPTVDVMAGVSSLEAARHAIPVLQREGWLYAPYRPNEMHWFCWPSTVRREYHLHLIPTQSATFAERLAFRDALRADANLADRYTALKQNLARQHADDREAYTEGKRPFIDAVIASLE